MLPALGAWPAGRSSPLHFFHIRLLPFCISNPPFKAHACKHRLASRQRFHWRLCEQRGITFLRTPAGERRSRPGNRGNSWVFRGTGISRPAGSDLRFLFRFRQILSSLRPAENPKSPRGLGLLQWHGCCSMAAIEPGLSFSTGLPVAVWGQLIGGRRGDAWSGRNGFL